MKQYRGNYACFQTGERSKHDVKEARYRTAHTYLSNHAMMTGKQLLSIQVRDSADSDWITVFEGS